MWLATTTDTHYGHSAKTHKIHIKFLKNLAASIMTTGVKALIHPGDWASTKQNQIWRSWKMFREYLGDLPILTVTGNHDMWDETWNMSEKKLIHTKYPRGMSFAEMKREQAKYAAEYNIHLLENNPYYFEKENIKVYGWNGWYNEIPPLTNDGYWMPKVVESCPIHIYLNHQAAKQADKIIDAATLDNYNDPTIKLIAVTHMPPYSTGGGWDHMNANQRFAEHLSLEFDLLMTGHTHQPEDRIFESEEAGGKMRIINAGCKFDNNNHGYDNPNFKIFEV